MLPIRGVIKQRELISKYKIVTPEMINEVADFNVKQEDQNKIVVGTLNAKVSMVLGSQVCIDTLDMMAQGSE